MKNRISLISFAISLLLLSIFAYQFFNEDHSRIESARENSSELYENTTVGTTRYQVFGSEGDQTVIMIPASNGYIEQWKPNIDALVNAGYKVLSYDPIGRGLSDRPRVDLNLSVFRTQLDEIISKHAGKKVYLVGSSFGGIIASDYAIHNRQRIEKLILIGPAGWPSNINVASQLIKVPLLGEAVFHYLGTKILLPRVEGYFYNMKSHEWAIDTWQKYSDHPGFMRSYLSTLRHSPVLDYTEGWHTLGTLNKPTLFIWGKQDISFPFEHSKKAVKLIPHAEIVGIEDAAHWVNIEKPKQVNDAILSFLSK